MTRESVILTKKMFVLSINGVTTTTINILVRKTL